MNRNYSTALWLIEKDAEFSVLSNSSSLAEFMIGAWKRREHIGIPASQAECLFYQFLLNKGMSELRELDLPVNEFTDSRYWRLYKRLLLPWDNRLMIGPPIVGDWITPTTMHSANTVMDCLKEIGKETLFSRVVCLRLMHLACIAPASYVGEILLDRISEKRESLVFLCVGREKFIHLDGKLESLTNAGYRIRNINEEFIRFVIEFTQNHSGKRLTILDTKHSLQRLFEEGDKNFEKFEKFITPIRFSDGKINSPYKKTVSMVVVKCVQIFAVELGLKENGEYDFLSERFLSEISYLVKDEYDSGFRSVELVGC